MANLTQGQKASVALQVMRDYSNTFEEIPITKQQLFAFIGLVDNELEQSEIDLFNSLPAGTGKTWLGNNPHIGRDIIIYVMEKRRQVL